MSLKIRLARAGAKKRPYYRIVVADSRSPRDGRYIEKLGTYDPLLPKDSAERVKFVEDRIKHWLGVGAQPTDRVLRFLDMAGIREARCAARTRTRASPARSASSARRRKWPPPRRRPRPPPKLPPLRRRPPPSRSSGARAARRRIALTDKPDRVLLGEIGAAQGLKGEVRLRSLHRRTRGHRPTMARSRTSPARAIEIERFASRRRR